ncbi:MADS-box transcription factor PHERES 2 [Linum perenne]
MKKRKQGLLKKFEELTILCGIEGTCIIYSPGESEPTVWPSHDVAKEMVMKYMMMPQEDKTKKAVCYEGYIADAILKLEDQLRKMRQRIHNMEMSQLMNEIFHGKGINGMDVAELDRLSELIKEKMSDLHKRKSVFL